MLRDGALPNRLEGEAKKGDVKVVIKGKGNVMVVIKMGKEVSCFKWERGCVERGNGM